ncbi:hypothetical protein J3F84DRAFT_296762 [Trichoderma pleuroticola]
MHIPHLVLRRYFQTHIASPHHPPPPLSLGPSILSIFLLTLALLRFRGLLLLCRFLSAYSVLQVALTVVYIVVAGGRIEATGPGRTPTEW